MNVSLQEAMEAFLGNWSEDLAPAWEPILGHCELALDAVDPTLELHAWEPIFPPRKHMRLLGAPAGAHALKAFDDVDPSRVRCVMVGQDPHPSVGQATGVGFEFGQLPSWAALDAPIAHYLSLLLTKVMFQLVVAERAGDPSYASSVAEWPRALRDNVGLERPVEPMAELVQSWKAQGVLLLNTSLTLSRFALTIDPHYQLGHRRIWAPLLHAVVRHVSTLGHPVVIVALGSLPDETLAKLRESDPDLEGPGDIVYRSFPHPAEGDTLFAAGNPLSDCNRVLVSRGAEPIAW